MSAKRPPRPSTSKKTPPPASDEGAAPGPSGEKNPIGRPPTKPRPPPLEHLGIVKAPSDITKRFELSYGKPQAIKKMFEFFKKLGSDAISVRVDNGGMSFFVQDSFQTCRVHVRIDGNAMNWFYCEEPFSFAMKRSSVEKLFNMINPQTYKITFSMRKGVDSKLHIAFKFTGSKRERHWDIVLSQNIEEDPNLLKVVEDAKNASYPMSFTLESKAFKEVMVGIKTYTSKFDFTYAPPIPSNDPEKPTPKIGILSITFRNQEKQIDQFNEVYRDHEEISLEITEPNKQFSTTVDIGEIKPLIESIVMDKIRIRCVKRGNMLVESIVEMNAIVASAFIEIKD